MNKAIQAQLAPGSTFKIIMSFAGLQEGVAQSMHVMCAGGGTFFGRFFGCDKHHGMVDIDHAIPWSCDTFYYTLAEKLGMPLEKVRKVRKLAREPLSMETPIGDEEDGRLGDLIEDTDTIQPIEAAIQSELRETTTRVLASLTAREERILRMRFGIGMNKDHTLEEVGQQFSVTRERIRQIEAKALRKLKHPSRSRILRSFLDH